MAATKPPTNPLSAEAQQIMLDLFAPLMEEMTKEAQTEIDRFDAAFSADHNAIGRILKVHLVIEQYLNEHIVAKYKIENLAEVRLTFNQKVHLLKDDLSPAAWVKSAIQNVNKVRNKFSHTLTPKIEWGEINNVMDVLKIARKGVSYMEPIDAIEAFAPVACAFLIEAPSSRRTQFEQMLKAGKMKFSVDAFF
ncbi:hypothetical protein [Janthinobacterium svalbardensis]|uniref:hypothetical protein n=1 Tax=Janthinobacterium svalbardensis TaxID=368607 RepID=UPI002FCDB4BD